MVKEVEMKLFVIISSIVALAFSVASYILSGSIIIALITVLCSGIIITLAFLVMYSFQRRIKKLREAVDKSEEVPWEFMSLSEGELAKLCESIDKMQSKLRESRNKEIKEKEFLRDILHDISHQIKTPIASLTVFNDLLTNDLEQGMMTRERKEEILKQSELQLERIKWLVQSLLRLARLEAEAVEFEISEALAYDLVQIAGNTLRVKLEEKNQRLDISEADAKINVDPEWFVEALINVIKNASDYSPFGADIKVAITQTPIATKICIEDNGPGIREADRLNVFKRFYRLDRHEVNPNSVGIGLALSRTIIESLGGKIWIESLDESEVKEGEKTFTRVNISV